MAYRTTPEAVGGIIELDSTITVDPFIETANALVTEKCVPAGYDDARLELIERWLAAHFYAVRDPRTTLEKAAVVSASYESKVDLGLQITRYGQQVLVLDTSGRLAFLNKTANTGPGKRTVTIFHAARNARGRRFRC